MDNEQFARVVLMELASIRVIVERHLGFLVQLKTGIGTEEQNAEIETFRTEGVRTLYENLCQQSGISKDGG